MMAGEPDTDGAGFQRKGQKMEKSNQFNNGYCRTHRSFLPLLTENKTIPPSLNIYTGAREEQPKTV